MGELRPRPGKFRINEKIADNLEKGKAQEIVDQNEKEAIKNYMKAIDGFIIGTEKYFQHIHELDIKKKHTIFDDLNTFQQGLDSEFEGKFIKFYQSNDITKSELFYQMYDCSPKMTAIVFMTYISPGKVMVYTNYVIMEGIDILKIYYNLIGFNDYTISKDGMGYCEYHGRIDPKDRVKVKNMFNDVNNIHGERCKVIMLSPSATEGIQLYNIRQEHILEPYWTEVRIQQVIGRGIRQCSHKNLPVAERNVTVYRYKVVKPANLDADDTVRQTTDEHIEDQAKAKANLIESFLGAMKEAAVDCQLFKAHNMMSQSYQCFQFPESTLTGANVGPAYREDIKDDVKYDSGLHAKNARIERIKVIKINAVYQTNTSTDTEPTYSTPEKFWYHTKTGMIYDYETHYPVGLVGMTNGLPNKLDRDTYIMSTIINIPSVDTLNL